MRFQIGDLIRCDDFGIGTVVECDDLDETLLVRFEDHALWVDESDCTAEGTLRFSLDEPPNFTERLAWWRELMPMWSGVPRKLGCTTEILVSTFTAWDCELLPVDASAVTVEAEGDPEITCDLPHYPWQRFGAFGRWDNTFIDHIPPAKWYRVEHGRLTHVASCDVTL